MLCVIYKHLVHSNMTFVRWRVCASGIGTLEKFRLIYEKAFFKAPSAHKEGINICPYS